MISDRHAYGGSRASEMFTERLTGVSRSALSISLESAHRILTRVEERRENLFLDMISDSRWLQMPGEIRTTRRCAIGSGPSRV